MVHDILTAMHVFKYKMNQLYLQQREHSTPAHWTNFSIFFPKRLSLGASFEGQHAAAGHNSLECNIELMMAGGSAEMPTEFLLIFHAPKELRSLSSGFKLRFFFKGRVAE